MGTSAAPERCSLPQEAAEARARSHRGERPLTAVVLAAGLGTRMRSEHPKVLHTLAGEPLILHALRPLGRLALTRTVVVVGHRAHLVAAAARARGCRTVRQRVQRGSGHALRCAMAALRGRAQGDVLILAGDVPLLRPRTLRRLVAHHRRSGAALTVVTANFPDPTGYGRIVRGVDGTVRRIVEECDAGRLERGIKEINAAIYCARLSFLRAALPRLRPDNAQGELYLTDIVRLAAGARLPVTALRVSDPREVRGVNTREELATMEREMRAEIVRRWMRRGVAFEDASTAYVGPQVRIGRDTVIGPNTHLKGRTRIGRRCRIDGSAYIDDSKIGDEVHLKFGVVMTESSVAAGAAVGPFAHLRPRTRIGPRARIGNFVETKNATVGRGTKASHLSYIGDAEVGPETNVGAGTITCNYDGFRKHRTVIGARVQIGSDTQLVAPVRVGNDAYVAAGTTVLRDVAPGSLAYNPKSQTERGGWVAARRAKEAHGRAAARIVSRKKKKTKR